MQVVSDGGIAAGEETIKRNEITYSKKAEGINMLRRLEPEKVAIHCKHYFSRADTELKEFNYSI